MRIGLSAWRLLGQRGGVANYLFHLLEHYQRLAPDDEFLVFSEDRAPAWEPTGNGRRVAVNVPLWENNLSWSEWVLPFALRRARLDLLHSVAYGQPCSSPGPSIVTVHDVSYKRHPEWFPGRAGAYLRLSTGTAARRAALLLTDSEFSAAELAELYHVPADRLAVIPLGVEPAFRPDVDTAAVRARYRLPERYVLYLGGIHTRRRADLLVEACARVLPGREASLVVAGPAEAGDYRVAEHVARLGLGAQVRLLGYVPQADLPALYAAASVFAWPTVYEGFGLPPLEALACGCPTVVANATSLPEVVGDAALRVPVDDTEALADALARLLDDSDLAAGLRAAGPVQAAKFRWEDTAAATLAAYRRVLGG